MNIDKKIIWHYASGGADRDYGNICLKWDVILKGPGAVGKWLDCAENLNRPSQELYDLESFCEKIKPGDLLILRIGREHVYGVGEIVGEYEWLPEFSDVDGLDLQHTRRVRWLWKAENSPKEFKTNSLMCGDTVQKLNPQSPVIEWLRGLEIPEANYQKPIVQIPKLKKNRINHY